MKRLLIAFFMVLVAHTAYAENYVVFKSDVVEKAINQLVASERRQVAADEYQKNMDQRSGKISVTGLYKVCIASGFNIQTNDGYNLCRNFLNFMISETENMGVGIASQKNCANLFNGVWTLSSDGTTYQCVGRDGYELVYAGACSGENGECIKQFAGLQTQGSNGREFINAYGKLHGLNLTCHSVTETRRSVANPLGQDYIKCSAGGRAYEFEFDDLNQTPGDKSSHSENTAICELYGGKIVDTGDKNTESIWQSCDISSELCNGAVADLAMRTGHTVQYQGYCRLSRKAKVVSVVDLHQIDGIDSRIFYNAGAQMRMDTAKPMVEEYLRTKFPNETYIVCDTNPRELNQGLGVDIDYVMSCTVGAQRVDFVFDDLSESFDSDAATGMDIMQCIINGGTFNGETCRGLTERECNALDTKLRSSGSEKGAYYDDDMRACVLGNAMATYQRNVVAGYVVGSVVIVGGTVLTIASGGAAMPVMINGIAMLATDIGINYAIDANHRRLSEKAAKKFVDFVTDADACTTEQCALDVLEKHYATLSGVMSDLNTDDTAVVDETMDRLIGLIQTEFVACGENDAGQTVYASPADCAMQQSHLKLMDYIDPLSEPVLIIASIAYNPGYVTNKFMKLKKVSKLAKLDDVADGINYDKKLRAAYQQYAPKNQSFDDFKKMFANEAEFDKAVAGWKTFEPGSVKMGEYGWSPEVYVYSPYSTYDSELAKQMRTIDEEYAGDIAALDEQIKPLRKQARQLEKAREDELYKQKRLIEDKAKERLGRRVTDDDWNLEELSDLKQQYTDIDAKLYGAPDYTPQEIEVMDELAPLENMREGYIVARDREKSRLINASIPNEVATAVAETRRQELVDIIASDDVLFAQVQDFENLSVADKQSFLQNVHSKLDDVTHNVGWAPRVSVYDDPKSSIVANAARQYNNSPLGRQLNANEVLNTIVHEQSHLVDDAAADLGMLGAQKANIDIQKADMTTQWETYWDWNTFAPTEKRYLPIETEEVYRAVPTEYSSYQVGSVNESAPTHQNLVQQIIERRAEIQ